MLRFPAQILPMMGFSSYNDSDVFQWLKLVSIGGSCSEPFSCLHIGLAFSCGPSHSIFLISKNDFHSSGISNAGNNKKKSVFHSIQFCTSAEIPLFIRMTAHICLPSQSSTCRFLQN